MEEREKLAAKIEKLKGEKYEITAADRLSSGASRKMKKPASAKQKTETKKEAKKKCAALKQQIKEIGDQLLMDLVNIISKKGHLNQKVKAMDGSQAWIVCICITVRLF